MKTTKEQKLKWERAKELAQNLISQKKEAIEKYMNEAIFYNTEEGNIISGDVVIEEDIIYVKDGNTKTILFENNPEFDHGLYSSMEEIEAIFNNYKMFISWDNRKP